jgi:acetyltransferase-like isoleucine patch superfamily enzyme
MKIHNYIVYLKQRGILSILTTIIKRIFFSIYKFNFKECGRIYIAGSFQITGKNYIEIGSLLAGSRIRIDAIHHYGNQVFHPNIRIGQQVIVNNDFHLACTGNICIGNNVLMGSHIYITDHDHGIYSGINSQSSPNEIPNLRLLTINGSVHIGDNVFIGEYVTILKNVKIGNGSIIGANTIITKDVPENSIVFGNPAKIIKQYSLIHRQWMKITT